MKGQPWGEFYNTYKDKNLDKDELEAKIKQLIDNEDVENKKGIYPYVLTGDEKYLNIRQFKEKDASRKYEEQQGICPICHKHFELSEMEADHIIPGMMAVKQPMTTCKYSANTTIAQNPANNLLH